MKKNNIFYIHKLLSISKLALVFALGYVVVGKVLLSERIEKSLVPTSALGGDKVYVGKMTETPALSPEDYADITKRNPFGTSDQTNTDKWPSMNNLTGSHDSVSEELGLALFGTISGSPQVARAIIKNLKNNEFDLYKIGQTVGDSRIESIDTDKVILIHNGERKILGFDIGKYHSKDDNNAQVSPYQTNNSNSKNAEANSQYEQNTVEIQTRIGCVETILKEATIKPCVADDQEQAGDQDQVEGLRITGLENMPAAKYIGLKNGDVIRSVNGHRLTSKQKAFQIFKKAKSEAVMNLELLRGSEIKKLSFSLQ